MILTSILQLSGLSQEASRNCAASTRAYDLPNLSRPLSAAAASPSSSKSRRLCEDRDHHDTPRSDPVFKLVSDPLPDDPPTSPVGRPSRGSRTWFRLTNSDDATVRRTVTSVWPWGMRSDPCRRIVMLGRFSDGGESKSGRATGPTCSTMCGPSTPARPAKGTLEVPRRAAGGDSTQSHRLPARVDRLFEEAIGYALNP